MSAADARAKPFGAPAGRFVPERLRHYLVIYPSLGRSPWRREWLIEHDPNCPTEFNYSALHDPAVPTIVYRCEVAEHVGYCGLDGLRADEHGAEWDTLPAGRYEIELRKTYFPGDYRAEGEWDAYLRVVRPAPEARPVISV